MLLFDFVVCGLIIRLCIKHVILYIYMNICYQQLSAAKTNHDRFTAMTHRHLLPHRRRTDRQQEVADIARTGEPHDPTNGDSVNQDGKNEQPWTPSGLLELGQND